MKWWKHRNDTLSTIWDLHIFLLIGDYIERVREREREATSILEMVKTQKWYYLHNMRSAYFPINRRLHRETASESEREKEQEREREAMSICVTVKTQKSYYLHNMTSAYLPINRRLHREKKREAMSIHEIVKHRNCTFSLIQDLHISLCIGNCIEKERERGYVHPWNVENTEMILSP